MMDDQFLVIFDRLLMLLSGLGAASRSVGFLRAGAPHFLGGRSGQRVEASWSHRIAHRNRRRHCHRQTQRYRLLAGFSSIINIKYLLLLLT